MLGQYQGARSGGMGITAQPWTVDSMVQDAINKFVASIPEVPQGEGSSGRAFLRDRSRFEPIARERAQKVLSALGPEFLSSIVPQYNPDVGLLQHFAGDWGLEGQDQSGMFDESGETAWIPASYSKVKDLNPSEFKYDPKRGIGTHSNNVERKSFLESTLPIAMVALGGPMLGALGNSVLGPGAVGGASSAAGAIGMGAADLASLGPIAGTSFGGAAGAAGAGAAGAGAYQPLGIESEFTGMGMGGAPATEFGVGELAAGAGGAGAAGAAGGSGSLLSKITGALGGGGALAGGGGLLGSIAPLLGAVAGAAGPSKQDVKSDSSSVSEPWGPQQEYLKKGFQRADDLYNTGGPQYYQGQQVAGFSPESEQAFQAIRNRATNGSPLIKTAQSELQKTIGGDYLNSNPWLDKNYDFAADALTRNFREAVAPSIDAQFSASGRYGSGMLRNAQDSAQDTLGRNLGGLAANMYGTNYANERNNQLKGMMFAPTMANQDYFDFEQLQGVGNLREQQNQNVINADMNKWNFNQNRPFQNLERYQKSIGGNFGGTSTSTQNQPVTRDRLSGAVGGLLAGSELVKNWGSIFGNK